MSTQWPRFEVFEQERPDRPHQNIGSVHAPDAEMAMQMARDVFARRPERHSLWVAPASAILARTAQELEADSSWREIAPEETAANPPEIYHVFQKQSQRRAMVYVVHVGRVEAPSPTAALARALAEFGDKTAYVWWICPEQAILRSEDADIESMFLPARNKTYRQPNEYRTVTQMKAIKRNAEKV
jgi:ring-1,2-phenylacetyl-CoA epoxidase subunit PaaB